MRTTLRAALAVALLLPVHAEADHHVKKSETDAPAPTAQEQIAQLEAMCAGNAEARAARHEERSLFERLGGEKGVRALTAEIMRLHRENEKVAHFFAASDTDDAVDRAARYFIWKTGGPAAYDGPSLKESHAKMKISDVDFVAAGGDIFQAMQNLEYGQEEIEEFVCILMGLRTEVVQAAASAAAE